MFISPRFAEYMKAKHAAEMGGKVAEGSAAQKPAAQEPCGSAVAHENSAVEAKDQHLHTQLAGGKTEVHKGSFFGGSDKTIEDTLHRASAKYPGAQQDALAAFADQLRAMTPGERDDIKDAIVTHMGSRESSQWDRDLLQKMYQVADAVAEHRKPPHIGPNKLEPNKIEPNIAIDPVLKNPFLDAHDPTLKNPFEAHQKTD